MAQSNSILSSIISTLKKIFASLVPLSLNIMSLARTGAKMYTVCVKYIVFNIKITGTYNYHCTLNSREVWNLHHVNLAGRECSNIRYLRFGSLCINCKYFYSFDPNCVSELLKSMNTFRHYTKIMFILLDINKCVVIKKILKTLFLLLHKQKNLNSIGLWQRNITKTLGIYPTPSVS